MNQWRAYLLLHAFLICSRNFIVSWLQLPCTKVRFLPHSAVSRCHFWIPYIFTFFPKNILLLVNVAVEIGVLFFTLTLKSLVILWQFYALQSLCRIIPYIYSSNIQNLLWQKTNSNSKWPTNDTVTFYFSSEKETGVINIYDGRGTSTPLHILNLHTKPVMFIKVQITTCKPEAADKNGSYAWA